MVYLDVCVCSICVTGDNRGQKRLLNSLETGDTDGCELPWGYWGLNLGPMEEQPVLITAESSL